MLKCQRRGGCMTSPKTRSMRRSSPPPGIATPVGPTGEFEDEPSDSDEPRFAALLSELARAPEVTPGRTLASGERAGEHEIVEEIGRGAFGIVYRAVHPVLGSEVAIKVLNSVYAADPGIAQRFIEEARAIHRIHHPNIVDLFGFGELPGGQLYYAMELLKGRTLCEEFARGACAPPIALAVLQQVAEALDAAHSHGVLHRDLKPDNIFVIGELGPNCKVKLLDFGIAKLLGDDTNLRTRSGVLIGTPGYMSPEQCAGDPIDLRSDIYALGVIAFELFTGERLFSARSVRETIAQHMFRPPRRASRVCPSLPAALDEPLNCMLDKQPARRPDSASAAIRALADAFASADPHRFESTKSSWRPRLVLIAAAGLVLSWVAQWSHATVFRHAPAADSAKTAPRVELLRASPAPELALPAAPATTPEAAHPPAAPRPAAPPAPPEKPSPRAPAAGKTARVSNHAGPAHAAKRARRELEF